MKTPRLLVLVLALFAIAFAACGKPSFESQIERYKRNIDKLDMLSAKSPQLKETIEKKKLEFASEMEAAKLKGGEDGAKALQVLGARMETFEKELNPQTAAPAQPAGTTGGKLGSGAQPAPATTQPAAGGSGFGGGAAPAPAPAPAPATTQPAGGSGFGGQ